MGKRFMACTILAMVVSGLPVTPLAQAAGGSSSSTGVASGDFNGDGHDDLAIGVPGEDVGPEGSEIENAGAVNIIYGQDDRLEPDGNQLWHQDQPSVLDPAEPENRYGYALAAGDFDGDGRDDLAIGVPGEATGVEKFNDEQTGAVSVLYGSANGLSAARDQFWTQDHEGIQDFAEDFDQFGSSLAAGNLGRGPQDDLVIGVPGEDLPDPGNPDWEDAGMVHALYGSNSGLNPDNDQLWHQDIQGVIGVVGSGERFGFSLAIADFGRSPHKDLAVGVTGDTSGTMNDVAEAGAVNVLYGSDSGLKVQGNQRWSLDSEGINGASKNNDGFGWAVAAGNLGRTGFADLAVGAAFKDVGPEGSEVQNAGTVSVIFGAKNGLRAKGDQLWTQDSPGIENDLGEFDNFGSSLAAANLGNGPTADLVVGVARENLPTGHEGLVHVIYGTPQGPKANGSQLWSQDSTGVANNAEPQDLFGVSLVPGNFGRSSLRDLAIGIVGEDSGAGAVEVLFARDEGLAAAGDQFWSQDSPQIKDVAEPFDNFGVGRFD